MGAKDCSKKVGERKACEVSNARSRGERDSCAAHTGRRCEDEGGGGAAHAGCGEADAVDAQ